MGAVLSGLCGATRAVRKLQTKTKGLPIGRPFKGGAAGRIRTHDPLVRSQVLYPTELQPHAKRILLAAMKPGET
ncbi:hypothetical protein BN2475_250140 [Paraburkholderia ribeironis]|uniref:Uncharacterized protein n=1 Tax=Paraburkholderia ribeironis TaxID=1247936 RepID=A0A1N7RZ04_9BURK|nr:hypothetical protein BN2475_250140 [Paraburkholderia ribeironis]